MMYASSTASLHMSLIGGEVDVSLRGLNTGTTTGGFKTTEAPKYKSVGVSQAVSAQRSYSASRNIGRMLVMIEARSCTPTTRKYPRTISSARVKRSKKVGGSGSDDGDENGWLYVLLFLISGNGNDGNGGSDGNDSNYGGSGDGAQDDYWMRDLLVLWFMFCAWSAWNVLQMALLPLSGLGAKNDGANTNRVTGGLACCVSKSVLIE